jgi:hypothetical protein
MPHRALRFRRVQRSPESAFRAASEHHRLQKAEYTQLLQREFDTRLGEVGQRTARPA